MDRFIAQLIAEKLDTSVQDSMSRNDDGAGSVPAGPVKCLLCGTELEKLAKTITTATRFMDAMTGAVKREIADTEKMIDYMEQSESESNRGDRGDEDEYDDSDEDDDEDSDGERRPWHAGCKWNAKQYPQAGLDASSAPHYIEWYGLSPEIALTIREITPLFFCRSSLLTLSYLAGDSATLAALNAHATDVLSPTREITNAYQDAFKLFLQALKDSNYPKHWIENPSSVVYEAYCDYMQARRAMPKRGKSF